MERVKSFRLKEYICEKEFEKEHSVPFYKEEKGQENVEETSDIS